VDLDVNMPQQKGAAIAGIAYPSLFGRHEEPPGARRRP
jgi:hypothetical protein